MTRNVITAENINNKQNNKEKAILTFLTTPSEALDEKLINLVNNTKLLDKINLTLLRKLTNT